MRTRPVAVDNAIKLFYEQQERIKINEIRPQMKWSLLPQYRAGFYETELSENGFFITKPLYTIEVHKDGRISPDLIYWAFDDCRRAYKLTDQERTDITRIIDEIRFLEKLKSDV